MLELPALFSAIKEAAESVSRDPKEIQLLAVSKGQPPAAITQAFAAGIDQFAENYWQEAQQKMALLANLPLIWHFIGPIQSNKTPAIAKHFTWVHSVATEKTALLLAKHRSDAHLPPLQICLQVNLDKEASKSGVFPEQLPTLVSQVCHLPSLKLRGLMAIPKSLEDEQAQYNSFLRLKKLLTQVNQEQHLELDILSMGMSNDFIAAIRAGSTMVRIGRALFGERK